MKVDIKYTTIKIPLKRILIEDKFVPILDDAITRTNTLVRHVYQFLRLYTLFCLESKVDPPVFTKKIVIT